MNCEEFQQRFQEWLDRRKNATDHAMRQHAKECDSCRQQWLLWRLIESSVAEKTHTGRSKDSRFAGRALVVAAIAASLLFAILTVQPGNSPSFDSLTADHQSSTPDLLVELDPNLWWDDLRQRDWVGQTMPTVRTVRDGVAPLGRSIQRAATLLATAPREQTS
jgi:hypothetical protein